MSDVSGLTPDEGCSLLGAFGLRCTTCTDGIDYCFELVIDSMSAMRSDIAVTEIPDFCE